MHMNLTCVFNLMVYKIFKFDSEYVFMTRLHNTRSSKSI